MAGLGKSRSLLIPHRLVTQTISQVQQPQIFFTFRKLSCPDLAIHSRKLTRPKERDLPSPVISRPHSPFAKSPASFPSR